ncbi:hypothetical protein [Allostreptomyces psammosilenae]|uniref:Uncharacterized protein n=1 Tax=Allostreptomyces psammosilenae TaxID=1892865 RepID=A0A852ZN94_9ACTN|nr:hypothetical protein [Allostreptomyces psammosilenae]NYI03916.1 hypothetical protein [Allostreptomyces psammosilenae]
MQREDYLTRLDARYDPVARMPWCRASGPGYHTRIPDGTPAHQTREAADYAIALLQDGGAERVARAHDVLTALVDLQVTDPRSEHHGIWGWFLEEPPERMAPADWNWADFIGVRLAQVLAAHGDALDAPLRARVRDALRHAARAIVRRDVGPAYTNIAVMGAVVTAAAGELLDERALLDYGRRRLGAVLALLRETDGFTEYNSPAYGRVVLEELERAALAVTDPSFTATARTLREHTWAALAERFHPGTGQLAGPVSRGYHDWLRPELADYLAARTGAAIAAREGTATEPSLVPPLPCPPAVARRFRALPADPLELRSRFASSADTPAGGDTVGTSWFTEDACLGSVNEEFAWTQRQVLLGYWRTSRDPAVRLRARMLLNGHDLSAAWCRQVQHGPRVLSAWWLSYDSGDFHPELDRPAGSVFRVRELRLRVGLRGRGVTARPLGRGRFALCAGDRRAVVHTADAEFLGRTASWQAVVDGDEARIEVVLHAGPPRDVDFHHARLRAAFALELLAGGEPHRDAPLTRAPDGGTDLRWHWDDLAVTVPDHPTPFRR